MIENEQHDEGFEEEATLAEATPLGGAAADDHATTDPDETTQDTGVGDTAVEEERAPSPQTARARKKATRKKTARKRAPSKPARSRTAKRTPRTSTGTRRHLLLTIDATKAVAPHRIRSMVKAMAIAEGDTVTIEVVGRKSGPRHAKAIACGTRAVVYFGGTVAA